MATHDTQTRIEWGRVVTPALLAVMALVSAAMASQQPLWVDEKITASLVAKWSYWELLTVLPQRQPHLPTYYLLVKLVGYQGAQLLSYLCFPLTALATVELASAAGHTRHRAQLAGYLVAVSPFLAIQASWLRMYAPLTLLLTLGLWWTISGQYRRALVPFVMGVLLHPFAILPFGWYGWQVYQSQETTQIVTTRRLMVASVPFWILLGVKYAKGGLGFSGYATGVTHGALPTWQHITLLPIASLVGGVWTRGMFLLGLLVLVLALYPRPDPRLISWILLPIVGVVAASYLLHPVFRVKYYGFIAPAVAVLLARERENWTVEYVLWLSVGTLYVSGWVFRAYGLVLTRYYRLLF